MSYKRPGGPTNCMALVREGYVEWPDGLWRKEVVTVVNDLNGKAILTKTEVMVRNTRGKLIKIERQGRPFPAATLVRRQRQA